MIAKFIRGLIEKIDIIKGNWNQMKVYGQGYGDNHMSWKQYQHYGFKSFPPEDCEPILLEGGNNSVSVAENDSLTDLSAIPYKRGNVLLYARQGGNLYMIGPKTNIQSAPKATVNALATEHHVHTYTNTAPILGIVPDPSNPGTYMIPPKALSLTTDIPSVPIGSTDIPITDTLLAN